MKKFLEKTISSKVIYKGGMISLNLDEVELPDGKKTTRDIVKHPGSVGIIAITSDNKLLLVEQFRKPIERATLEIPAGKLEEGECPKECALRELEEETGYKADYIEHLVSFYASPGYSDEYKSLYFASSLKVGEANPDEDECVELKEFSFKECQEAIQHGQICDAKTLYAILYCEKERILK